MVRVCSQFKHHIVTVSAYATVWPTGAAAIPATVAVRSAGPAAISATVTV